MTSDESDLRSYMQLDQESIRAWLHLIGHVIFFFFFSGRYLFIDTTHAAIMDLALHFCWPNLYFSCMHMYICILLLPSNHVCFFFNETGGVYTPTTLY